MGGQNELLELEPAVAPVASPLELRQSRAHRAASHPTTFFFPVYETPGISKDVPKLRKKPRIRLLFQTPELYKTDIGDWIETVYSKDGFLFGAGSKWACKTWIGDKMVGEKAKTFIEGHPMIIFHGFVKRIRVHL